MSKKGTSVSKRISSEHTAHSPTSVSASILRFKARGRNKDIIK